MQYIFIHGLGQTSSSSEQMISGMPEAAFQDTKEIETAKIANTFYRGKDMAG